MKKLSLQGWRTRPISSISVFPSVYTVAYATGQECLRKYGAKLKSVVYVLGEKDMDILMETQADYRYFSKMLVDKFKKQPSYLNDLISWSEDRTNLLYDFVCKKFNSVLIPSLSNNELAKRYNEYVRKYLAYHLKNTPSWWIGALAAETELKKYLNNNFSDKNIDYLLSMIIDPLEFPSENFNEELSLLNIAIKLKNSGKINGLSLNNLPLEIKKNLANHVKLYSSIPFGYKTGIVWDGNYFLERIKKIVKNNPVTIKENKLKERKQKIILRDKLTKSLNLPLAYRNLIEALRKLSYLQELKKTMQTRSHPILQLVVNREISKRLNLDAKYIEYLSEQEIALLLKSGYLSAKFRKVLISRASLSVLIVRNMKYSWLTDDKARQFMKLNEVVLDTKGIKVIRGQIASKGRAAGIVKICQLSTEINKVKKGNILVTAMTTPDFVPAMRKAAAIITDEGGITSHAAIVARELNKPCIIGAKIASKILKDGDMVEVDANAGVIKILKRA